MFSLRQQPTPRDFHFEGRRRPITGVATDYAPGSTTGLHHHSWDQFVYAAGGVMTVTCPHGVWVVPPQRAVWMPAGTEHELHMRDRVALRTLYLAPGLGPALPGPIVLTVSPLLREVVLRAMGLPDDYDPVGPAGRLVQVLLDELQVTAIAPLNLPLPTDPRAAQIAARLRAKPADTRTLGAWAREVGASERTLARHFAAETGLAFGAWRQQARLLQALVWLAQGRAVTRVALDLGYAGASAFVAAFRRAFGTTPGRYFR